ncbi:MAG: DUF58 domain-containing protein [Clostridiales bacterium]|nr:DUF58 domain-containing protein [Clostridiales bacterium]
MSMRAVGLMMVAATMLVVALSTGAPLYYLLFAAMATMLALALITATATALTLSVSSQPSRTRVARGDSVSLKLLVRRRTILPVSEIEVLFSSPSGDGDGGSMAITLGPMASREYRYALRCPHRGRYEVGAVGARVTDIFGLFTIGRRLRGCSFKLDVTPRVRQMEPMVLSPSDLGRQSRIVMTEDASSPSDVRAWRDGDVLKRVHWKLTMRKRELMVRNYEESARPDTLILMDVSPISASRSQALDIEDGLCEAALSMALAQLRSDHGVRMPLACSQPAELAGQSAADFSRFLDAMVGVPFDGPYAFELLMTVEMRRMQRTGGVVLVTSRLSAAIADLALRMRSLGMQVMFIWVTESARTEALELLTRIELGGVTTMKVDPWDAAGRVAS